MAKRYRGFKIPVKVGDEDNKRKNPPDNSKLNRIIEEVEKSGEEALEDIEISTDIEENFQIIQKVFKDCSDLVVRRFTIGEQSVKCLTIFIDGIVDKMRFTSNVLQPLMLYIRMTPQEKEFKKEDLIKSLEYSSITLGELTEIYKFKDVAKHTLMANCILIIDGNTTALAISTAQWQARGISESTTENVAKGPKEAFIENIRANTALLRKKIQSSNLKMEVLNVGRFNHNGIIIAYIKGIADEGILNEVRRRIKRIDIDVVIESSYIEQLIEDDSFSPFPQMDVTERPDTAAAALAEGRIVILVDNSPFVLIVPTVFANLLTSAEDYYERFFYITLLRILRYISFGVALLGPSIYVAITTFHQEMVPTSLLVTFANARADIPFPAAIEALLMEFTFEILKEAGLRLPKAIGQAVSIVGALVIGEAAVQAGIVSQIMVIVVALTGIASFTIPKFNAAVTVRFLRFPFVLLAGTLGIFGIIMGILFLLIHMASLRSFGVPYLSPFTPMTLADWKDTFIRLPIWLLRKRPSFVKPTNINRIKKGLRPKPPKHH
ncbi:MAG: spore germination protein [Clostridia bacterium]|nr:spore germination protein [Clostridia bacterium]